MISETDLALYVKKNFPNGMNVVQDGEDPVKVIGLEVGLMSGAPAIFGWAWPNKDMYYPLTEATSRDDGLLVTSKSKKLLLTSLPKADGDKLDQNMRDYT